MRVAILGAGGQIGRGLSAQFGQQHELYLFSRDPTRVSGARAYDSFPAFEYDLIINAAGPGDPATVRAATADIFRVTEFFDNLVLDYLAGRPTARYVFLSTGAVYLNGYTQVAGDRSRSVLPVNQLSSDLYYPIAKIHAEAKHRALAEYNIADIRIFGYFSRHIPLGGAFFLSDVATAVVTHRPLRTTAANFIRDYVCASDLVRLINCLQHGGHRNGALDLVSAAPVSKADLVKAMASEFGMRIELDPPGTTDFGEVDPLPSLSDHSATASIGYMPSQTSLEVVQREMRALVGSSPS